VFWERHLIKHDFVIPFILYYLKLSNIRPECYTP